MIESCYLVDMQGLLGRVREELSARDVLREESFMAAEMEVVETGVQYRDIEARWVIFCDGVAAARKGISRGCRLRRIRARR